MPLTEKASVALSVCRLKGYWAERDGTEYYWYIDEVLSL